MVYSDSYLNKVVSHFLAIRCNMWKEHQVSISSPYEALAVPVFFFFFFFNKGGMFFCFFFHVLKINDKINK